MKKLLIILIFAFIFWGCTDNQSSKVTYLATLSNNPVQIEYLNKNGNLVDTLFDARSEDDQWQVTFPAEEGEILFLSGKYRDIQSSLKLMIIINGKVYKEAYSEADTNNFLIVSGTVPYK